MPPATSQVPAIFAVQFVTAVPLGEPEESVSNRTVKLSAGDQTLFRDNLNVVNATPFHITLRDLLVFPATLHIQPSVLLLKEIPHNAECINIGNVSFHTKSNAVSVSAVLPVIILDGDVIISFNIAL